MQAGAPMAGQESQVPAEETATNSGNKKSVIKKAKAKAKDKMKKLSNKLKKPKGHGHEDKQAVVDESVGYEDEEEDADEDDEPEESVPQSSPKDLGVPLDEFELLKKKASEEKGKDGEKVGENLPAQTIAEQAPQMFRDDGPPGVLQAVPTDYHYRDQTEEPKTEERDSLSKREPPNASNEPVQEPKEERKDVEEPGDVEFKPTETKEPVPANEEVTEKPEEKSTGSKLEEEATANALDRTDVTEIPNEGREEKFQQQRSEPDKENEEHGQQVQSKELEKDEPAEETGREKYQQQSSEPDKEPEEYGQQLQSKEPEEETGREEKFQQQSSEPDKEHGQQVQSREPEKDELEEETAFSDAQPVLEERGLEEAPEVKEPAVESYAEGTVSKPDESHVEVEQPSTTQKLKDGAISALGYGGIKTEPEETSEAVSKPEETSKSAEAGQEQPQPSTTQKIKDKVAGTVGYGGVKTEPDEAVEETSEPIGQYGGESEDTLEAVSKPQETESVEPGEQQPQPTFTQKLKDSVVGTLGVGGAKTEPDETSEAVPKPEETPEPLEGKEQQPKVEANETSEALPKPDEPLEGTEEQQQQPSTTQTLMDSVKGTFGYGVKREPDEATEEGTLKDSVSSGVKTKADESSDVSKPEESSELVGGGEQQQTSSLKDAILNKLGYGGEKSDKSAEPAEKHEENSEAVETAEAREQQPGTTEKVVGTATQLKDTLVNKLGYAGAPNSEESKETSEAASELKQQPGISDKVMGSAGQVKETLANKFGYTTAQQHDDQVKEEQKKFVDEKAEQLLQSQT